MFSVRRAFAWNWGAPLLIVLVVCALYGPALFFDFVYDDHWTVVSNASLDQIRPVKKFFLDSSTIASPESGISKDAYRPLATFSFALNKKLGGLNPAAFRWVNLLLHIVNGCLIWFFLARWFSPLAALLGALFFIAHPIQVESVVWISQRSVLLCGMGALAGLRLWDDSDRSPLFAWGAVLCYVFALLGKEAAVLLPFVLVGIGLARGKTGGKKWSPALIALFIIPALYLVFRRAVLGRWGQGVETQTSLWISLAEGASALPLYVRNIFWPARLNVSYPWISLDHFRSLHFILGVLIFFALFAGLAITRRKKPLVFAGVLMFAAFWLPHGGAVPLVTFAADRFMYLPLAGVSVLFACMAQKARKPALLLVVPLLLSVTTFDRVMDWKNETALWRASIRENPRNPFAQACYAQALLNGGHLEEAERHYKMVIGSGPTVTVAAGALKALVLINQKTGDEKEAEFWRKKYAEFHRATQKN